MTHNDVSSELVHGYCGGEAEPACLGISSKYSFKINGEGAHYARVPVGRSVPCDFSRFHSARIHVIFAVTDDDARFARHSGMCYKSPRSMVSFDSSYVPTNTLEGRQDHPDVGPSG
jgi:hypothetical protein